MENKLEQMMAEYKAKKEKLMAQVKAELAPVWEEVVEMQKAVKKANDKAKAEKAIENATKQLEAAKAKLATLDS